MSIKQIIFFGFAFLILLGGRLMIAGTGYLEDTDELLYLWMKQKPEMFSHLSAWVEGVTNMQGQPPEMAIRLLEYTSLLPIATLIQKQPLHPDVLYFIGLYNIIVSLLILYVFFRIAIKLNFSIELSLLGVVLLGTLFNYNIYTRHILPYDHALLFQLLAFNILLKQQIPNRIVFFAGALSAIGLTTYFGSFIFSFINGGYLFLDNYKKPKTAAKKCLFFTLPFILLISFYEIIMQVYDKSYLGFLTQYSTTVNMASFDEGFTYLFIYFYQVEKWWGMFLLFLFFLGSFLLFKKPTSSKAMLVLLTGTAAYISYGAYVYFSHKMVFHGRILHTFYPFIIIGVLGFIQHQNVLKVNHVAGIMALGTFVNYTFVINDFNRIGYPRNTIYNLGLFEEKGKVNISYNEELATPIHYYNRAEWDIDSVGNSILPLGDYVLENFSFNFHYPYDSIRCFPQYLMKTKDSLFYGKLHFQSHPAYALEYCARDGREFYIDKKLFIRVIKLGKQKKWH
jgi:hypothetical protein